MQVQVLVRVLVLQQVEEELVLLLARLQGPGGAPVLGDNVLTLAKVQVKLQVQVQSQVQLQLQLQWNVGLVLVLALVLVTQQLTEELMLLQMLMRLPTP